MDLFRRHETKSSMGYSGINCRLFPPIRRRPASQRRLESFRYAAPDCHGSQNLHGNYREKMASRALMICRESWMNGPDIAEAAFARAWSVYRLIHSGIDENDARRAGLQRFIRQRCEAGQTDTELLAVEGLKYLKGLEGLPED
jgi:hypothetical protein